MADDEKPVTKLLKGYCEGDEKSKELLFELVYGELRRLAGSHMRSERPDHTLAPTALVHEAYLRLVGVDVSWSDRKHFFAIAATMMRRILVDHSRDRTRKKRGGAMPKFSLDDQDILQEEPDPVVVQVDDALQELAKFDPRKAKVIELLYFGGFTVDETAEILDLSPSTVHRELKFAKAWISQQLKGSDEPVL